MPVFDQCDFDLLPGWRWWCDGAYEPPILADIICEQPPIKRYNFKVFWHTFSQCTPVTGRKDTKSPILKTPLQKSIIECTKGGRKCCFV